MRRLTLVLCCLSIAAIARATVLVPIDFRDLVTASSAIVHGRVTDVRSEWIDGRRAIQTFVTVDASDYLKGDLGRSVTFTVPGGRMGRYLTVFVGAPVFRAGDEVVLFLKTGATAHPVLLGLSQGVLRVHDGAGGEPVVSMPGRIPDGRTGPRAIARAPLPRRPVGLDQLRTAVRRVLATAARP